jgi:uncharacterized protein YsxB (DUF464 family)
VLEVTFFRDARQRVSSLLAAGHAGAGARGKDLVCAGASAILQAAELGLQQHAKVALLSRKSPGTLELRWPAKARGDAAVQAIVATAELALRALARQYPRHVRVRRRTDKAG